MTDTQTPQRIGRYEIKQLLGAGAMGSVYLAEDPRIKRKLAIKLVKLDTLKSEQDRRELLVRFEREAEISGILNDPGIVTIYDLGDSEFGPFLAMEYVEGAPLDALIKRGDTRTMALVQRFRMLAAIAAALDHAHAHGIIHRDVKPANVMITEAGRPKLMDFGIAKREDAGLTQTGTFLGTPSYASPEQIKDGCSSTRSDVFSLGVLAFELLSGELPFQGNSINTILYRIVNEPPVEIHPPVVGIVPEAWRRVFLKVLAKNPAERHATCGEFVDELMAAAQDLRTGEISEIQALLQRRKGGAPPITIRAEDRPPDPSANATLVARPSKRRGWMWFAAAGVAAAAVAGWLLLGPKGQNVLVQTQPKGARVMKDGRELGVAPMPVFLKPGESLAFELKGYESARVTHQAGQKDLQVELKAKVTQERLVTEPAGATVVMDERRLEGTTPLDVTWNQGQPHSLTFTLKQADGDLVAARDFKEGETPEGAPFKLQTQGANAPPDTPGTLRFVGAFSVRVKAGGKDMGEVRQGGTLELPPGDYRLDLSNGKVFFHQTLQVQIQPGQPKSLPLPDLARLTVDTYPKSGVVVVDGAATGVESDGTTPITMVKGTHAVSIQGVPGTQRQVNLAGDQVLKFQLRF